MIKGGYSCWVSRGGYSLSGRGDFLLGGERGLLTEWEKERISCWVGRGDYSLSGRRGGFLVSGRWMEYPLRERGDYFPSGKGGFLVGWV